MIHIDFLIRTNRRSVSISVSPKCEVVIKAPRKLPFDEIQKIVNQKESWIILHKQRIQQNNQLNNSILNYEDILFCGQVYHLIYDEKARQITLNNSYCIVPTKYSDKLIKRLTTWYKKVAFEILSKRLEYFCTLMQLKPTEFKLTNAKTCWGTCNSKGVVSLNWRLIMTPHELIDYVIVHELAHLVQLNHSKLFWDVVRSVLPDFATRRKNLKQGDYLLSLYRS